MDLDETLQALSSNVTEPVRLNDVISDHPEVELLNGERRSEVLITGIETYHPRITVHARAGIFFQTRTNVDTR
ncbi:hypothetical protein, partial [Pseudomonas aeruginosa]|uniref:hypothetical protein n=1 Tax=Pseudomonas aeruginosa TaxID=287 RepID=UPI001C89F143